MSNPFTLSFGKKPFEYISRIRQTDEILEDFTAEHPVSQVYMLTGVRGSGKTVMMATIANHLAEDNEWIVVELNPTRDLLTGLASRLYEKEILRAAFVKAKLDFSILGIGVSIDGAAPTTDIEVAIERMLKIIKKMKKRVLITIDEVENSQTIREFVSAFQIFMREEYPVFLLMTGLYENISALQNSNNVTFLYRAPKVEMGPLDTGAVVKSYMDIFDIDIDHAKNMASLTMGYPFAYQVMGFLCYKNDCATNPDQIIPEYDQRLSEYVYTKIWSEMSDKDRKISVAMTHSQAVSDIMIQAGMNKSGFSPYRARLIKRSLAYSPERGKLCFQLPRFAEFVEMND
jgi:energy-coupling factor transporter ATP-binding protein EcfA2